MINILKQLIISFFIFLILLFLADYLVGKKMNKLYNGWNHKGYRGEIKTNKIDNQRRIVFLGSSALMGWGLKYYESIPYLFEKKIKKFNFDVVNLALQGNGINGVKSDVKKYQYLNYDIAVISSGYTDCNLLNEYKHSKRGQSILFKYFNYLPSIDDYIIDKFESVTDINLRLLNAKDNKSCFDKKIKNKKIDFEKFEAKLDKYYINEFKKTLNFLISEDVEIFVIIQPDNKNSLFNFQKQKLRKLLNEFNYEYLHIIDLSNLSLDDSYYLFNKKVHLNVKGSKIISEKIFGNFSKIYNLNQ